MSEHNMGDYDFEKIFANMRPRSDKEMAQYEAEQRERRGNQRWAKCQVPRRHRLVLDNGRYQELPEVRKNLHALKNLSDGFVVGLFGARGSGKTQLAVRMMRERCMQDRSARYITLPDLQAAIQDSWDDGVKLSQEQTLAPYLRCSLLVLDEIGERKGGDWDSQLVTRLVAARYREMLDTILIGNVEPAKLNETLPSVMRRIYETSGVLAMNTPVLRLLEDAA